MLIANSYPSVLNEFLLTRHESWHFRTFNTQHVQCYPEHSISTATVPSKSKSSHSTSMKALLNSTNFWASGYTKWTVHRFFCSTYPLQMELQLKTTNLFFHMLLNPTGGCFSYLACFQPMAAEPTIFRNGCKACKRLPLHVLTSQKKIESIFCGGKRRCFDTPWHRMFVSPQRWHFCRSKALEAPFSGAPRLGFGWEHAARLRVFVKARCFL